MRLLLAFSLSLPSQVLFIAIYEKAQLKVWNRHAHT